MKGLPFRAAFQTLRYIGLASLMLVVLALANHGEAVAGGADAVVTTHRGKTPPPAHEEQQLSERGEAIVAFAQTADEQPDEDPVLDIALDVAGWSLVTTRTIERVRSGETCTGATQVVLRARPARGPPV